MFVVRSAITRHVELRRLVFVSTETFAVSGFRIHFGEIWLGLDLLARISLDGTGFRSEVKN